MPTTDPRLLAPDAHHSANRLIDALERERSAVTAPSVLGACIDAETRAHRTGQGPLMRRLDAQRRDGDPGRHTSGRNGSVANRHTRLNARVEWQRGYAGARLTQTRPCTTSPLPRGAQPPFVHDLSR
jgi:hypothetical protein